MNEHKLSYSVDFDKRKLRLKMLDNSQSWKIRLIRELLQIKENNLDCILDGQNIKEIIEFLCTK